MNSAEDHESGYLLEMIEKCQPVLYKVSADRSVLTVKSIVVRSIMEYSFPGPPCIVTKFHLLHLHHHATI